MAFIWVFLLGHFVEIPFHWTSRIVFKLFIKTSDCCYYFWHLGGKYFSLNLYRCHNTESSVPSLNNIVICDVSIEFNKKHLECRFRSSCVGKIERTKQIRHFISKRNPDVEFLTVPVMGCRNNCRHVKRFLKLIRDIQAWYQSYGFSPWYQSYSVPENCL